MQTIKKSKCSSIRSRTKTARSFIIISDERGTIFWLPSMDVSVKALLSTPLFICFMHFILWPFPVLLIGLKKMGKKKAYSNLWEIINSSPISFFFLFLFSCEEVFSQEQPVKVREMYLCERIMSVSLQNLMQLVKKGTVLTVVCIFNTRGVLKYKK